MTTEPGRAVSDGDRAREFHDLYTALRIRGQLEFYRGRRDEYARANRQAIVVRNMLLVGAAIAGAASQLADGGGRAGCAVAGAVLGALAAAVAAYAALIGFPQLEKLYSDAARNLEEADLDWSDLDPATDLTSEIERVEGVFRSEIGQWGQLIVKDAPIVAAPPETAGGSASVAPPGGAPPTSPGGKSTPPE
jgi:hypothetical protein